MPVITGCSGQARGALSVVTRPTSMPASASEPTMMTGTAAAPRAMTTATDTVHAKPRAQRPLRRPLGSGSDLQHFSVRSGFKLACVHGHRQHAVIADGAGQLDEPLIAEPLPE